MDSPSSTPMLKQYHAIKSKHQDCILFFRLGDFYEMFYEDAHTASKILDLVLTSRGKDKNTKVPMCGIPFHAADNYIAKLIKAGKKVAICEQVEDPAAAKGIVKRDVIRTITSGTYLDENNTEPRYILCLNPQDKTTGVSFIDPATGTIFTNEYTSAARTIELIAKLPVFECVYPLQDEERVKNIFGHPLLKLKNIVLSAQEDWSFNNDIARKSLCEHFGTQSLKGFGIDELNVSVSTSGALLEYLKQMNKQPLRHIDKISLYADDDYVFISPAAFDGLEFETLLKNIDFTLTPLGKRKLRYWLYHPLKSPADILQRQAAVKILKKSPDIQQALKKNLQHTPDIERHISRLSCGYVHAKDVLAIRNTLAKLPDIKQTTADLVEKNMLYKIDDIPKLRDHLQRAINEDIPLAKPEGKIVREGYHKELDELRTIQNTGKEWLAQYQKREIQRSKINSLKVGYNKVFGYYIEITKTHTQKAPDDYIRKQTLVNAERYITPELKEYEEKILTAQDKIFKIENEILKTIQKEILDHSIELHAFAHSLATLDVLYSLNILAQSPNYILPHINEDTLIDIKDGRHPVVEKTSRDPFVANDTLLNCDDCRLVILTGPNMAGKSTYIRQTAVLVILAQMGSYIPAKEAAIGVVDKVFTRIGAHDDIAKGQSTFMVEMSEAADILNNMTERSLIILDEIGRGTSTYDGLSLAWALAEHIQKRKARTLFATHYHELTRLADELDGVQNYNVAVKEWKDEIVFLHKIIPGSTDDSYGIYVAKLAGIPQEVIKRSKHILTQLELQNSSREKPNQISMEEQLSLFNSNKDPLLEEIRDTIEALDIDNLTPVEALNKIQKLKERIRHKDTKSQRHT